MKLVIFYDDSPKIPRDNQLHRIEEVEVYDQREFDIAIFQEHPKMPNLAKYFLLQGVERLIDNEQIIDAIALVRWCTDWNFKKARNFVWCYEKE